MKKLAGSSQKDAPTKRRKSVPPKELALVGARIRAVRKNLGVSQDKLAYAIPLDRAHIGMIENGKRAATIPTLIKIAVALNCEVGEFFPPVSELRSAAQLG
ncbi:MAG: helix-turn-helix transcriptional regulator [Rudaea sp.]|uniref:helix-turn-helix domain-containing protein n=1 Tax=unclassified Rudaea TaxID=2627037 RepID=UPI0010F52497|nr:MULTISPECIES: helix-turn-helix transcriptional regulator [unclassified Rudaea]MBN8884713.1 helix-turn-helix transcriptional regulator [Rudaea sp.]